MKCIIFSYTGNDSRNNQNEKKIILHKDEVILSTIIFFVKISITHTQHHYKFNKGHNKRNPCPTENKIQKA